MKKITFLFLVILIVTVGETIAQGIVSGTVVDSESSTPLPGANVMETGSSNGTTTDFDGKFSIKVENSTGEINISYVGFESLTLKYDVSNGNQDLGSINLALGNSLEEIIITQTSFAVDRKTPVAVSTIKADVIEEKLGTQEFPEILKSTPGIYATRAGGGFGDADVTIRGFNSVNVAVLINGIPVNDMENGRVFWSNWAGLSDVTSAMQVQRGLGAVKVAVPAIGGTINVLTRNTDVEAGGNVMTTIANNNYQKYSASVSTGLMDNGWAVTASGAKVSGDGYVDGTGFSGFNYFLNISKEINDNHKLSFSAFGAKQQHGQRQNKSSIADIQNSESGIRYNPDWGIKNGEKVFVEDNFYHKPQISLNHYWTISDITNLSTVIYASWGTGGGGRRAGDTSLFDVKFGDYDQPIDLDNIVAINRELGAQGLGAEAYLGASRNDHNWYGLLSTLKHDFTDHLSFTGGIDVRTYKGIHFREITDLLGGNYALIDDDENNPNTAARVGDKYSYYNDGLVDWLGGFAQLEYEQDNLAAFMAVNLSNTSYARVDYFNYLDSDPLQETDTYNFLGYGIKGGANYNLDDNHNVFANIGYFEKAADFDAVFQNFNNENINENAENQKIFSAELGYGYRSSKLNANINVYRTQWNDRTFTDVEQDGEVEYFLNAEGVNALHQGVELDFVYRPSERLTITGMLSLGDWTWADNVEDAGFFDVDQNPLLDQEGNVVTRDLYIKDLKVGRSAQTTSALGLTYKLLEKTSIAVDYNYYADLYADFEPNDRTEEPAEGASIVQPWKVPDYNLFDASLRHGFLVGSFDTTITLRMNNVFNTEYINVADDGGASTAADALVWYGPGRTYSISAKFEF
ncbi:TonB-dependent receptor [Aquimarina pacifica]|uniref:TonB-dependent receptor n=1 Tax=Aquimarina pacifica TaxID=1296415 RepID=UPI00046F7B2D|nr:carboxypeptidase-like regulatory domain-containing protein [Aquimarina pacifica]